MNDLRRRADANFCGMFRSLARGAVEQSAGGCERPDGCLIATGVPIPLFNPAFARDGGTLAEFVAAARDFYANRRLPWALVIPAHAPAPPARAVLRALGLYELMGMPVYTHPTHTGTAWPTPDKPMEIRAGQLGTAESPTADHRALLAAAFGIPPEMSRIVLPDAPSVANTTGPRLYVAYKDGAPVGSAALCTAEGVAGVYNVAAHPEHRRQGIATALMRRVLDDARALGLETAILQSSSAGMPLYARLGFGRLATYTIYRPGEG